MSKCPSISEYADFTSQDICSASTLTCDWIETTGNLEIRKYPNIAKISIEILINANAIRLFRYLLMDHSQKSIHASLRKPHILPKVLV